MYAFYLINWLTLLNFLFINKQNKIILIKYCKRKEKKISETMFKIEI